MKKYFVFAIAALGMMAACQKNQDEFAPVDNDAPVAVQFGINAPSLTVTKTKAAVDSWNGETVYVYGFQNNTANALGAGKYDVTAPFINAVSADATAGTDPYKAALTVTNAATGTPFYYSLTNTYDFYGFYLGDLTLGTATTGTDMISYELTIDGSQDIMYAKADQAIDVANVIAAGSTTLVPGDEAYAYSAWAARRGVHPTLVFEHALTRFNFFIEGRGTKFNTVTVNNIQAKAVETGTLTVVGENLGYVAETVASEDDYATFDLKMPNGTKFSENVVKTDDPATTEVVEPTVCGQVVTGTATLAGDCIMVAPKMTSIDFLVTTSDDVAGTLPLTTITLTPDMVDATLTEFAEGTAYNVTIIVYGPEEISITAELTPWADGGDVTYDPDEVMKPTI